MAMAVRWKMNVKHMKTELKTWEKRYEHHTKHAQISFYLYYLSLLFTARVTSGNNNTICCEYGCQTKKKIIHFPISQWEWIACHEVAVDGIDTDTDSNGRKSKRVDNFTENMGTVCACVFVLFSVDVVELIQSKRMTGSSRFPHRIFSKLNVDSNSIEMSRIKLILSELFSTRDSYGWPPHVLQNSIIRNFKVSSSFDGIGIFYRFVASRWVLSVFLFSFISLLRDLRYWTICYCYYPPRWICICFDFRREVQAKTTTTPLVALSTVQSLFTRSILNF